MAMASSSFLELTWFMRAITTAATSRGLVIARLGAAAAGGLDCCPGWLVLICSFMGALLATVLLARRCPPAGRSQPVDCVDLRPDEVRLGDGLRPRTVDAEQRQRVRRDGHQRAVHAADAVEIDKRDRDLAGEVAGVDPKRAEVESVLPAAGHVGIETGDGVGAERGLEHEDVVADSAIEGVVAAAPDEGVITGEARQRVVAG